MLVNLFLSPTGSLACESQCVLEVQSVLRASQWEQLVTLHFPPVFYVIRNFGKPIILLATYFHADFLLGLQFDLEDGGYMILRNFDWLSGDYTALYHRR
jgi:hypothetical protein